ncbi:MAG: hypothetical protein JO023_17405 [Chloroflexi bacterium]|nr:hypothetical protein [Chloroflexota bacterium]
MRSFIRSCQQQGSLDEDLLVGVEHRPRPRTEPRAVAEQVETAAATAAPK